MSIDEIHARYTRRDPVLIAALYAGDPLVVAAVFRLLRLTPLSVLGRHPGALVEVLAAMPDHHAPLRGCWSRQDAGLTATLFSWVEQARLRVRRADHDAPLAASRTVSFMQAEELAFSS